MQSCTNRGGPDQPTILILDDDRDALEEIQEILELEDLSSIAATGPDEAMAFLSRHAHVDVVVTDVHIAGTDGSMTSGVDFMAAARARYPDRHLSFIVLSGDADAITASIETGAIDFLTKPLMPEALLSAIQDAAAKSGENEEKLSDKLMRKVAETTRSLQRATVDLAEHERALSESQSAYDHRRLQGAKLRQGLSQGHIAPWFQPQVCLHSGALCGFEALVRWDDPVVGLQNPVEFLPLAEEIGMMLDLDAAVQRQAFDALKEVRACGLGRVDIGINVTAGQLADPELVDKLCLETDRADLQPTDIGVEILESAMLDEVAADPAKANINRLAALGFRIELDDFGTGHAGLSSLRDLEVSRIKIDRSFVCNIHQDHKLQNFTRALIGLAKTLGIAVLAEGVESEAELAWLEAEGCDLVQGYFVAKPMPKHAAIAWAQEHAANRAAVGKPIAARA